MSPWIHWSPWIWKRYSPPRNIGKKLPNYTAQQPRISGSSLFTRWKPVIFLVILCSSFIESCCCRIDFLRESVTIKISVIFGRHSPWIRSITSERKGNWGYCWVLRILRIWLLSQQGRCVAVHVPQDPGDCTGIYCRCSFVVLKHSVVSKFEFDGAGFVTDVLCDISSLASNRWSIDKVKFVCCRFYMIPVVWCREVTLNYFAL